MKYNPRMYPIPFCGVFVWLFRQDVSSLRQSGKAHKTKFILPIATYFLHCHLVTLRHWLTSGWLKAVSTSVKEQPHTSQSFWPEAQPQLSSLCVKLVLIQISHYMLNLVSWFLFILFTIFSSSQAHNTVISDQEYLTKVYFHCRTKSPNNFQKSCKTLKMLKQGTDIWKYWSW